MVTGVEDGADRLGQPGTHYVETPLYPADTVLFTYDFSMVLSREPTLREAWAD